MLAIGLSPLELGSGHGDGKRRALSGIAPGELRRVAFGAEFRRSVHQVLLMLELQLLQISRLVAVCPAGAARTKLQQQHDQLLGRLAAARQHARALIGD